MRSAALLLMLLPSVAFAAIPSPCSFTLGHGSVKVDSKTQPEKWVPYWFTVSGRAELEVNGTGFRAKLFDANSSGEQTHTLSGTLSAVVSKTTPFNARARASLKNLFSDAGDDSLAGTVAMTADPAQQNTPVLFSLVVHNAYAFVAVSCYGKGAT